MKKYYQTSFTLKIQKINHIKMSQINKISEMLLFFPSFKMIKNFHFCLGSSIDNQMLHNVELKKHNWDNQKRLFKVIIMQNFWDSHY